MKKTITAAVILLACLTARAQEVSYALPKTTITVEVAYTQEIIHAGKYAKYAKDLLGIEVLEKDTVVTSITQFKIQPRVEADQSRRYSVNLTDNTRPAMLALTAQGLVAGNEKEFAENGRPKHDKNQFGRQINYRKPQAKPDKEPKVRKTFYDEQLVEGVDSLGNPVIDTILVEIMPVDSLLIEAKDAARRIREYRDQRYRILTGDTDASYAGEALGTALAELSRLEAELMQLFEPETETVKGKAYFDISPDREGRFTAFALDQERGPVKSTKSSLDIFDLLIEAEPVSEAQSTAQAKKQPTQKIVYRIPAICTVTLTDGTGEIMSLRMPIYQLGLETNYPIYN